MEKFTKGTWEVKATEDDKEYIRIRGTVIGGRFKICNVNDSKEHHKEGLSWCAMEREESMSNAHLISASPEMYNEIVSDISWLEQMKSKFVVGSYEFRSICLRIESKQKLLAKARGEL